VNVLYKYTKIALVAQYGLALTGLKCYIFGMKSNQGTLVSYKNQPAVVVGFDGDKIEIETANGVKKVREKDFERLHAGPVKKLSEVTQANVTEVDLAEAWDFFSGETPMFLEIAELAWGEFAPSAAWKIWTIIAASPWFNATSPEQPITLRSKEEAEAIVKKASAKNEEESERAAFRARFAATLKANGGKNAAAGDVALIDSDAKYLQDVEALALGKSEKSRTLRESNRPETQEEAHRVLLATGYWPLWKNPWPAREGHSLQSSTVPVERPSDEGERLDLTAMEAYAIDNEWSADPDDAVSVDGDTLWVHIADPAASVGPDSAADKDARSRGSTLYVPEGAARMLEDRALEYYALGLAPISNALSFGITFTETGAIDDVSIKLTKIRVTRLTYAEASRRREEPQLARLFAIADRNIARRKAAGAVFIDLPEVHISANFDAEGNPTVSFVRIAAEPAADMVREMMLLAGEATARFAFKNELPFQYVSQESPEIPKDLPTGLAGEYRKRRSMKSRKVGTIPSDHAGLGIGMYSQVTSPLRRYGDLVAHQQIRLFLAGKKPMDVDDMLTRIAQGDAAARQCTFAERHSNLHWTIYYLLTHPEWSGEAVIVEIAGPICTILIPEFAQESKIPVPAAAELGSTIRVRAGNANLTTQTITFAAE